MYKSFFFIPITDENEMVLLARVTINCLSSDMFGTFLNSSLL